MVKIEGINTDRVGLYNQAVNRLGLDGLACKKYPYVQDDMKMMYIFDCMQAGLVI